MTLTQTLGHKSIGECQRATSSYDFVLWKAYYRKYPFGFERDNLMQAANSYVVAASAGNKKAKFSDFLLEFKDKKNKPRFQSAEEIMRVLGHG